jgi:hypothetical protein
MPGAAALPLEQRHEGDDTEEVGPVMRELPPPGLGDDLLRVYFFIGPSFLLVARCVKENTLENLYILFISSFLKLRLIRAQVERHLNPPQIIALIRLDEVHRAFLALRGAHTVMLCHVLTVCVGVRHVVVITNVSKHPPLNEVSSIAKQLETGFSTAGKYDLCWCQL